MITYYKIEKLMGLSSEALMRAWLRTGTRTQSKKQSSWALPTVVSSAMRSCTLIPSSERMPIPRCSWTWVQTSSP